MKYLKSISIVLLVAILGFGCTKNSTVPSATNNNANSIVGNWRVSAFIKDNADLTSQFSGYTFYSSANGNLTIKGNGYNYNNCNWNWNNSNYSVCHFLIIGCSNNSALLYLQDDWDLTNYDANHCDFASHDPDHHFWMTWTRIQ